MTRKTKLELNRANDLADIDAELDSALERLEQTTSKVHDVLAREAPAAGTGSADSAAPPAPSTSDSEDSSDRDMEDDQEN